jgi:hypothetical protein
MTLGPRAKKRAGWLAVIVLVVIGGVGYRVATATSHAATQPFGTYDLGISYGFTPAQVRHRLGAPSSTHGSCWIYRASSVGMVRGIHAGVYTDAVRFCFSANIVTDIHDHQVSYVWHNTRYPAKWILPLTLAPSYETIVQP